VSTAAERGNKNTLGAPDKIYQGGEQRLVSKATITMGVAAEVFSNLLLFMLVFGMAATVESEHLKKQINNRKAFCIGLFLQFVVLPFLGFLVVFTLRLEPPLGITLLVVTSSPGGSYSNW
jgi:predicted Na+-dependent transporter